MRIELTPEDVAVFKRNLRRLLRAHGSDVPTPRLMLAVKNAMRDYVETPGRPS